MVHKPKKYLPQFQKRLPKKNCNASKAMIEFKLPVKLLENLVMVGDNFLALPEFNVVS